MLLRENFRGGHDSGLKAVFNGADGGQRRNHGFTRADVARDKPLHGALRCHVSFNFRDDALLSSGKRKGKTIQKPGFKGP